MDDVLLFISRLITIALGALFCDEVLGLLVLLAVALTLPDWGAGGRNGAGVRGEGPGTYRSAR